jgi:GxxExxY protein
MFPQGKEQKAQGGRMFEQSAAEPMLALCDRVRCIAYDIHTYLGHGHLEKVYENALAHRLIAIGMRAEQQVPICVYDKDGTVLGDYIADLLVDGTLIIEIKATRAIALEHIAQLLGYLKASRLEHGLLINFGSPRFEIRKLIHTPR